MTAPGLPAGLPEILPASITLGTSIRPPRPPLGLMWQPVGPPGSIPTGLVWRPLLGPPPGEGVPGMGWMPGPPGSPAGPSPIVGNFGGLPAGTGAELAPLRENEDKVSVPPLGPSGKPQERRKVPDHILKGGPIRIPKVHELTLEEKIGQMTQVEKFSLGSGEDVAKYFIGSVLSGGGGAPDFGNEAEDWADMVDYFQMQTKNTRLQIPILYGVDAVHGHNNVKGATIFPHHIGLGATRNPLLVKEVGAAAAQEVAATGIRWAFSPAVSVCCDARWGRTYESFGERTELVQMMTSEIDGWQEKVRDPTDPAAHVPGNVFVAACAKHFVGDGGTKGGIDQGNAELTEEELRKVHLAPYLDSIGRGVLTIMASYSSWNGTKMHAHHHLLTSVLKEELGFQGLVVSDWEALQKMPGDWPTQVRTAVNAGVDMIMVPMDYKSFIATLKEEVTNGRVPLARIDDAVSRILWVKEQLGLFEVGGAFAVRDLLPRVGCAAHREIACRAVRESLVLLRNERRADAGSAGRGGSMFPLSLEGRRILVGGTHADDIGLLCGGWSIAWQGVTGSITPGTTVLQGIRAAAAKVGGEVLHVELPQGTEEGVDFAVMVVGEPPYAEGFGDDQVLQLPPLVQESVERVAEKMPCVLVLVSGRPLDLKALIEKVDVVIAAWLPGTQGGEGIADVLFGEEFDFTGRLPISWFKSAAQLPLVTGSASDNLMHPYGFGLNKNGQILPDF